ELAQSVKSLDAISRDIDKLSQYITNKVFFNFLVNPIIPDEKKKGILEDITNDAKFQPYTLNFLYILIDKKRIDLIGEIFKEFETVYNKLTDTELAVVSSVVKLENRISLVAEQTMTMEAKYPRAASWRGAAKLAPELADEGPRDDAGPCNGAPLGGTRGDEDEVGEGEATEGVGVRV
ncbi:hypothetical protein KI387_033220, partial [Taxus chinensis]